MNSFKARLGQTIQQNLEHSQFSNQGISQRKSLNQSSRLSGGSTGSVLNERVTRINDKINEIQGNIEKGKHGRLEEYERKIVQLEEKFDEAIDTAEKKFDIVDEQLQHIQAYLNTDKKQKEDALQAKRDELAAKELEISETFQASEKQRLELEKKFTKLIDDHTQAVQSDVQLEARNRHESIEHIKACLKNDFPRLEDLIRREIEDRVDADEQLDGHLNGDMSRIASQMEDEKKAREETEETMIEMFKDMINKIKAEIDQERCDREQAEEALLSLLEETCMKLNKSVAL